MTPLNITTLQSMINLAETMEKVEVDQLPDGVMAGISQQREALQTMLNATTLEEDVLKRLEGKLNL